MPAVTKGTVKGLSKLLDMSSAARRKRAKGLGFDPDEVWYHGSRNGWDEDKSGPVWLTSDRQQAENYARGGDVYAVLARGNREPVDSRRMIAGEFGGSDALVNDIHIPKIGRRPEFNATHLALKDSNQVRSVNAAFDPAKKESRNLLASLAPVGVGTAVAAGGLLAPEEAEASFVGEGAQGIYKGIINAARKMADDGVPREEIWQKTWNMGGGAYKGLDGKWRVEVDDASLQMKPLLPGRGPASTQDKIPMAMDEALSAPALIDAYPDLADARVTATGNVQGGSYMPATGGMFGNERFELPMRHRDESLGGGYTKEGKARSTTAHELQHAIQEREGFSVGGNYGTALLLEARAMNKRYPSIPGETLDAKIRHIESSGSDVQKKYLLPQLIKEKEIMLKRLKGEGDGFDAYRRLGGEVEARNVQERLDYTPEQRAANYPWDTEDVHEWDQIRVAAGSPEADIDGALSRSVRRQMDPARTRPGSFLLHGQGMENSMIPNHAGAMMISQGLDAIEDRTVPVLRPFLPTEHLGDVAEDKWAQGRASSALDKFLVWVDTI
jgi:hypothetical protein